MASSHPSETTVCCIPKVHSRKSILYWSQNLKPSATSLGNDPLIQPVATAFAQPRSLLILLALPYSGMPRASNVLLSHFALSSFNKTTQSLVYNLPCVYSRSHSSLILLVTRSLEAKRVCELISHCEFDT